MQKGVVVILGVPEVNVEPPVGQVADEFHHSSLWVVLIWVVNHPLSTPDLFLRALWHHHRLEGGKRQLQDNLHVQLIGFIPQPLGGWYPTRTLPFSASLLHLSS